MSPAKTYKPLRKIKPLKRYFSQSIRCSKYGKIHAIKTNGPSYIIFYPQIPNIFSLAPKLDSLISFQSKFYCFVFRHLDNESLVRDVTQLYEPERSPLKIVSFLHFHQIERILVLLGRFHQGFLRSLHQPKSIWLNVPLLTVCRSSSVPCAYRLVDCCERCPRISPIFGNE